MTDLPLSKLKIKIHALDNPTSVFKKRNLLSLNCINKSTSKKKSITPIRTYTNDLPHYMLPTKSNLSNNNKYNTNNSNNKNKSKNIIKNPYMNKKFSGRSKIFKNDSKIKLPHLSREKSDNMILKSKNNNNNINNSFFTKINPDISMPSINNNNINNSFHNFKINEKNMNLNKSNTNKDIVYNKIKNSLNDNNNNNYNYSLNHNLNDTNNEILLSHSEQNNPTINNNSSDSNCDKNIPKHFESVISDLQKKINEQNLLLSERIKEIEYLKKQINENNEIKNNYFEKIEYMNNLDVYKNEN